MSDVKQFSTTQKTSVLINPVLYKALRVKIIGGDRYRGFSDWLRAKMYEEVIEDGEESPIPEFEYDPTDDDVAEKGDVEAVDGDIPDDNDIAEVFGGDDDGEE